MKKLKYINVNNLPPRLNILLPFIVYTMVSYWNLPIWVFAVFMTFYSVLFLASIYTIFTCDSVDLVGNDK